MSWSCRPDGAGHRLPRRVRDPPVVRADRRRPVPGPGLRARPGPLLGDGLPPPRDCGADRRAVRADQVGTDAFLRTLGWRRVAEQEWEILTADTRRLLQAYADGVNAWIAQHGGSAASGSKSLEYSLLGLPTAAIRSSRGPGGLAGLAEGHGLGPARQHGVRNRPGAAVRPWAEPGPDRRNFTRRIRTTGTARSSPAARSSTAPSTPTRRLRTAGPRWRAAAAAAWKAVAPALGYLSAVIDRLPHLMGTAQPASAPTRGSSAGSTTTPESHCWPTTRTCPPRCPASGTRWGCTASVSSMWRVSRFSGVPGVVIGHNARIAWGFTNLDPDVTDLFLEKVDGNLVFDGTTWVGLRPPRRGHQGRRR